MDHWTMTAIVRGARELRAETEGLSDALQYVEELADDVNSDLNLALDKDSAEYKALYVACADAIRKGC